MLTIDAKSLHESIVEGKSLLLIDVRQPEELAYGTIQGSHLFSLSDIPGRIDELEKLIEVQSKKTKIVFFCRIGGRSEQVINLLERRGSRELINLVGGTIQYSEFDVNVLKY